MARRSKGVDPYKPPHDESEPDPISGEDAEVNHAIIEGFKGSRQSLMVAGMLAILAAVLLALLCMLIASRGKAEILRYADSLIGMSLLAVILFAPSVFLLRYGNSIDLLVQRRTLRQLLEVLRRQASFWRAVGIMMVLLGIGVCLLIILVFTSLPFD